jgi:hypothetical protein
MICPWAVIFAVFLPCVTRPRHIVDVEVLTQGNVTRKLVDTL